MLAIRAYADVICVHTWHTLPAIQALRAQYPEADFQYIIYPLYHRPEENDPATMKRYKRTDMAAHNAEVALHLGRPSASSPCELSPPLETATAALYHVAAGRQGRDLANGYFEVLLTAAMRDGRNVSQPDLLLAVAAEAGLDPDRLAADAADPAVAEAARQLQDQTRARGVRSRPTLIIAGPAGREYWVQGPRLSPDAYAAAVAAARSEVLRADPVKQGGRVIPFVDLEIRRRLPVPGGWRMELAVSDGRPDAPKAARWSEWRALQLLPGVLPAAAEAFVRACWQEGVPLGWARGRDQGGTARHLLLVRAAADSSTAAGALAERFSQTIADLAAAHLGTEPAPAGRADLAWLERLPAGEGPLVTLHWVPGRPAAEPYPETLGPGGLLVLADPVPPAALAEEVARVQELGQRWEALRAERSDTALRDSLAGLAAQQGRLAQGQSTGWWLVWAAVLPPEDRGPAAYRAAEAAYADRREAFPLRQALVSGQEARHLRLHAAAQQLCQEQELHGTPWWNSHLSGVELARYLV